MGDQRCGGDRRRDRHGGAFAERPPPTLVAEELPEPTSDRRGEQEDPGDRGEAQLPPHIAAGPGIESQGHCDREQQSVSPRSGTTGKGGDDPCRAHHSGALDRWSAACQRDVDGDQRAGPEHPCPQGNPEHRQQRGGEQGQEDDVLPGHREQVGQPGAAEIIDRHRVDPVVLAEHETARQRRLAVGRSLPQAVLGAAADRVETPGQPAPGFARRLDPPGSQQHRYPLAPERCPVVVGRSGQPPAGPHAGSDLEVGDGLRRPEQKPAPRSLDRHPHLSPGPPRDGGDIARNPHPGAGPSAEGSRVDRPQPGGPGQQPGDRGAEGDQRQPDEESRAPARPQQEQRQEQRP